MSEELRRSLDTARALRESGNPGAALAGIERSLARHPGNGAALLEQGLALQALARHGEAAAAFERVLSLDEGNHAVRAQFALALAQAGRANRARREFARVVAAEPDNAVLRVNLAAALRAQGRLAEAIEEYRRAAALDPALAEAQAGLGIALRMAGEPALALQALERAALLEPGEARTLAAAGDACRDLARFEDAVAWYRKALARAPGMKEAATNLGQALLLLGRFAEGWDATVAAAARPDPAPGAPAPWNGEDLAGRALLVRFTLGLGDQVMFASCLPDLVARGARCAVTCEPRLEALFARSFPQVRVLAANAPGAAGTAADFEIAAHELPRLLRRDLASFPAASRYLVPAADARSEARRRLDALGGGLKVGVSWRGGTAKTRRDMRTIPLRELGALLATPGARFVSLQYDDPAGDVGPREAPAAHGLAHWPEIVADPDRCAALIAELDLVISVPTTVVHLAGALGKPLWILTPYTPDYRYLAAGERMPWYPEARLLRQAAAGDWSAPLAQAQARLGALAAGNAAQS